MPQGSTQGRPTKLTMREWMLQYAPYGYRYVKTRIPYESLEFARMPADLLSIEIEQLRYKLERSAEGRFQGPVATFLTVYPKDIGETLNHLDPLRPRFGIEIEMRQPAAKPAL